MFRRILIANRGEIAQRILRACRELNVESVCVFSEEDRGAGYLDLADRAICIGGPAPRDSYLKSDRIIAAAEVAGADAIHPGYGFLAENAAFAEKCRACNIEFIGPNGQAIRLLGDKASARALAKKAKVPTVPGSDGILEDDNETIRAAALLCAHHPLKGYDAVQLAAALRLQQTLGPDKTLVFVAGDKTVTTAAQSEGLTVDNPLWHVEESE